MFVVDLPEALSEANLRAFLLSLSDNIGPAERSIYPLPDVEKALATASPKFVTSSFFLRSVESGVPSTGSAVPTRI
ncbi:hypothetical protein LNP74_05215 [Klebsiella pneumoniae subsp. pneumoniae]|nr:hypothetical protein [Klebsiella pneumoniae subsp. pneumoniae]